MKLVLQGFLYKTRGPFIPFDNFIQELGTSFATIRIPLKARDSYLEAKEENDMIVIRIDFGDKQKEIRLPQNGTHLYKEEDGVIGMKMELKAYR